MAPHRTTESRSSSANLQQQRFWKADATSLASDCKSLREWILASPVLGPIMNTLSDKAGGSTEDCFCHTVMANLLFHQRIARGIATRSPFEACLYLQRILEWTWTTLKQCEGCRGDETLRFVVAGTAKDVLDKHRITIEDTARFSRQSSSSSPFMIETARHARQKRFSWNRQAASAGLSITQTTEQQQGVSSWSAAAQAPNESDANAHDPSLIGPVPLRLGQEAVHKSVGTVFLCRLARMKLQQLAALLSELVEAGPGRGTGTMAQSPLHTQIADIQECIKTTTSMLSTLD